MAGPTVMVRFMADTKDLQKGVTQADKSTGGFKANLGKVATAIGGAFAAKKVVDFAKESVNAAKDLNANLSRTETIFGGASNSVVAWSQKSAEALRMPQSEALAAANTIGKTLVGSYGMSGKAAAGMSIGVVQLAKDMATFNRVPFDQALNAVTKGLGGATRGLKTLGVSITANEVTAKALSMGLGTTTVNMDKVAAASERLKKTQLAYNEAVKKHGKNSSQAQKALLDMQSAQRKLDGAMAAGKTTLSAGEKAQATYALMLEKTKMQQGATAKASGSLAAAQERMRAEWKNAQAQIGQALLPVLTALVQMFSKNLVPIIKQAVPSILAFIKPLADLAQRILPPLLTVFRAVIGVLQAVMNWIGPAIPQLGVLAGVIGGVVLAVKAWALAQAVLNAAMAPQTIVILAVVAAIAALVAIVVLIVRHFDTLKAVALTVWNAILGAAQSVWRWIQSTWSTILGVLRVPFDAIRTVAAAVWNAVLGAIRAVWNWVKANWPLLLGLLTGPIGMAAALIFKYWDTVKAAFTAVKNWIVARWNDVVSFFTGIPGRLRQAGAAMWNFVKDGITGAYNWVHDKLQTILFFFGGIPAKLKELGGRMWDFILDALRAVIGPIRSLWNNTVGKISFKVPSWVPGMGGKGFAFPKIPEFARGAVVAAPTLGIFGERSTRQNPEIVTPANLIREVVREESGPAGPVINIEHATFNTPADIHTVMREAEMAYRRRTFAA